MDSLLIKVLTVLTTSVIIPLIVYVGQRLAGWLKLKAASEKSTAIIERANSLVNDVLKMISQTVVDDLKAKGMFDKTAQRDVQERAKCMIMSHMSDDVKDFITKNYGDLNRWVLIKIESAIYEIKN